MPKVDCFKTPRTHRLLESLGNSNQNRALVEFVQLAAELESELIRETKRADRNEVFRSVESRDPKWIAVRAASTLWQIQAMSQDYNDPCCGTIGDMSLSLRRINQCATWFTLELQRAFGIPEEITKPTEPTQTT